MTTEETSDSIIRYKNRLLLFIDDAGVRYKRRNWKGEIYSIAEEAVYEFLRWDYIPWER
jgi:hypothetical protein